jgi:hypothetical protein
MRKFLSILMPRSGLSSWLAAEGQDGDKIDIGNLGPPDRRVASTASPSRTARAYLTD